MADVRIGVNVAGAASANSELSSVEQKIAALDQATLSLAKSLQSGASADVLAQKLQVAKQAAAELNVALAYTQGLSQLTKDAAGGALTDFAQAGKLAQQSIAGMSSAAEEAGINIDRMAERIAIRLVILAAFNSVMSAAVKELGSFSGALLGVAEASGVTGESLHALSNAAEELQKGSLKNASEALLAGLLKFAELKGYDFAAIFHNIAVGFHDVTNAQAEQIGTVAKLQANSDGFYASLKNDISLVTDHTQALLAQTRGLGALTDANRAAAVEEIDALQKKAKAYPELVAQLETLKHSIESSTQAEDEYSKVLGIKTPAAIKEQGFALDSYIAKLGDASKSSTAEADTVVNNAERELKWINALPEGERAAFDQRIKQLQAWIAEFESHTSKYEKASDQQAKAAEKLAEQEAKALDERRKNYEKTFESVAAAASKLEDQLSGQKEGAKSVADLAKTLQDLRDEQTKLGDIQDSVKDANRAAELPSLIAAAERDLETATKGATNALVGQGQAAGPALAAVSGFLDKALLSSEGFHKIYAEQSPATQAAIQAEIEHMFSLAQSADGVKGSLDAAFTQGLSGAKSLDNGLSVGLQNSLHNIADIFRTSGGEASKYANILDDSARTVTGAYTSLEDKLKGLSGDSGTIVAGEKAVKSAFDSSKPAIDAETESLKANTDAKAANVAADAAITKKIIPANAIPAGQESAPTSGSPVTVTGGPRGPDVNGPFGPEYGPGGIVISNEGGQQSQAGPPPPPSAQSVDANGNPVVVEAGPETSSVGPTGPQVPGNLAGTDISNDTSRAPGEQIQISIDSNKTLKNSLDTLRKDGYDPAKNSQDQVAESQKKASEVAKQYGIDTKSVQQDVDQYKKSIDDATASQQANTQANTDGEAKLSDVVAASNAARASAADRAKTEQQAADATQKTADNTQKVADSTKEAADDASNLGQSLNTAGAAALEKPIKGAQDLGAAVKQASDHAQSYAHSINTADLEKVKADWRIIVALQAQANELGKEYTQIIGGNAPTAA